MRHAILLVAVVACGTPATSLNGTTSCTDFVGDDITCTDGQICIEGRGLPDDGSIPPQCTTVMAGCEIHNCVGTACPVCVQKLCTNYPQYLEGIQLAGRTLHCP